ncbi:hypothetical protein C8J56DRAFT_883870 [Mycena floridula]|nr:hypothetical protein C8J56DRAFT_883870 [Mycena floridula]
MNQTTAHDGIMMNHSQLPQHYQIPASVSADTFFNPGPTLVVPNWNMLGSPPAPVLNFFPMAPTFPPGFQRQQQYPYNNWSPNAFINQIPIQNPLFMSTPNAQGAQPQNVNPGAQVQQPVVPVVVQQQQVTPAAVLQQPAVPAVGQQQFSSNQWSQPLVSSNNNSDKPSHLQLIKAQLVWNEWWCCDAAVKGVMLAKLSPESAAVIPQIDFIYSNNRTSRQIYVTIKRNHMSNTWSNVLLTIDCLYEMPCMNSPSAVLGFAKKWHFRIASVQNASNPNCPVIYADVTK